MEKCGAGQATYNMAHVHCMLDTYAHAVCVTVIAFPLQQWLKYTPQPYVICTLPVLSYISIDKENDKTKAGQGVLLVNSYSTVKTLMEQDLDNITVIAINIWCFSWIHMFPVQEV
jgi:hypothetical protein